MACNEVEFYAQLLRKYLVKDAATLLLAEFSDWVAMTKKYGRDPKFAISIAATYVDMNKQLVMKAVSSHKSFMKLMGTVFHNGTAPVRALVDTEWKKKQIDYRMLIREYVIGLVNAESSPLV
jgi:hypothetical protein